MTDQPNTAMTQKTVAIDPLLTQTPAPITEANTEANNSLLVDDDHLDKHSNSKKQAISKLKAVKTKTAKDASVDEQSVATELTPHPILAQINERCFISAEHLKRYTQPSQLPTDTRVADDLDVGFGQQRAIKALQTAVDIKASGYHVFAAGENGLGKRTIISRLLRRIAGDASTPDDWVYVHNFSDPRAPLALSLPSSQALVLQRQVTSLWQQAYKRLNQRFRSDHYQNEIEAIKNQTQQQENQAYDELSAEGKQYNLALTFRAFDNKAVFVHPSQLPESIENTSTDANHKESANELEANKRISDESHTESQSSQKTTAQHEHDIEQNNVVKDGLIENSFAQKNHMHKRFSQLTIVLEQLEDDANSAIETLHKDIAERALKPLFTPLYEQFVASPLVVDYLRNIFDDMIEHVERIVNGDDEAFVSPLLATTPSRYSVNIMVSHETDDGAPVIFEDLPTHLNLLGHVEQITQLGTVTTDVSMIRAGALHRANGGYLILEASHVLEHPYAWQGLKRALQSRKIKLSSLEQMLTLTGSLSLAPAPIELDVKVILLGEADLYYELLELEPEFDAVFKVRADFHDDVTRTPEHELALVAKMADIIDYADLYPFDSEAQAALLEHLSLQAEDQNRLSLHSDRLIKLLQESNRHARLQECELVDASHVTQAIADMDERSSYLRDLYWQELKNGQQLINTQGEAVGQVNALTVVSYADSEFGMPARLTALIQPNIGAGEILDIERDVDLGGSLHAKGMLIMTSYLRALFSRHHALNFSASLAFEQSYAHIDGDSATVSEACAILSALADVPINQALAITGSMNQLGEVQAVGGINAKIAGFFDACREQGLTGEQGVVIPMANVKQLMLRDDIIEAVDSEQFYIYGVNTLSEALTLMTGLPIDIMTKKGRYRKETLFGKVLERLMLWDENQAATDDIEDKKAHKAKKKAKARRKAKKKRKDKESALNDSIKNEDKQDANQP